MVSFITGGTGLLGSNLIDHLLARGETVYALLRPGSGARLAELRGRWGAAAERVVAVEGDLLDPDLSPACPDAVDHFFHLAALQDLACLDEDALTRVNVEGTRRAVALARSLGARRFHHGSSWAVAGAYDGLFDEGMFEQEAEHPLPYFRSKREAEAVVRGECDLPWRIYRPGIVVGRSDTGEMDEVDGLYHLFGALQTLGDALPRWAPLPRIEGGYLNVVPVDYVAAAMDHLAFRDEGDGACFHLTNPQEERFGDVLDTLARAARAPSFSTPLERQQVLDLLSPEMQEFVFRFFPPGFLVAGTFLDMLGIPSQLMGLKEHPTRFDCSETQRALAGTGIRCPELDRYARRLWHYWQGHLDPELLRDDSLEAAVGGKTVLVTGASSGIGEATACHFAKAGAKVLAVARSADKLEALKARIESAGGRAQVYPADLSDDSARQELIEAVLRDHGGVDILVNNAGRAINRMIEKAFDRLHDYERVMALNYFGPVSLCLGFLPGMRERGFGHVINVLSLGAQAVGPGATAYSSSKSALETFADGVRIDLADDGIHVTNVYMGLVHTPMSAPTRMYADMKGMQPEDAAELLGRAAIERRVAYSVEAMGPFSRFLWAVWPEGAATFLRATGRGMRMAPPDMLPS
ncbi:MAG: SDR family oxidoreductase [Deltaproteobacteria bacterium]|nr:SDR family oxidoreductase [Deltaproteobacteria bacterium]MBW2418212.1 SDR family oxidoreductase [Deltaproteobacteria bacterium]